MAAAAAAGTGKGSAGEVPYRLLGSSGLRVFPLGLGTMHFGQSETFAKWNIGQPDPALNEAIFLRYIQAGGNFIDTANFYQGGESERQVGSFIAKHKLDRERLVLATKYSLPMVAGDPNRAGNHKKNLFSSVKDSLRRLGTDYIDLLYVHFWDFSTPVEDLMRALNQLVESGMVLHVAASDIPAWVVAEANTIARARGWNPFVAYQGKYSLVERSLEQEVLPMARHFNIGTIPWGALGQGKLTGKVTRDKNESQRGAVLSEADFKVQDEVLAIAKELNRTPTQVALNWAMQRTTSPLLGPRTLEQLEENLAALQFTLSPEHVKRLDGVSKDSPPVIFPHYWNGNDPADCPWLYAPEKKYSIDVSELSHPAFPIHN